MIATSLFGIETEYAVGAVDMSGRPFCRADLVEDLLEAAMSSTEWMSDAKAGIFLANGARLYGDCGGHPEFCTPECLDPWDAVRYVRAGERLLLSAADRARAARPGLTEVWILRSNVDYSSRATWGCHESYLCRTRRGDLARQLIPHLVSRVIYTGAGGFVPQSEAAQFTLSPRSRYIGRAISCESTAERGIFHTREQPLAAGYRRVHVILGESLCSDLATWLKIGTTALVVALIDAGAHLHDRVAMDEPVDALHAFAADPDCRVTVRLANGRRATAIQLQRDYLAAVQARCGESWMPRWAADVCREWSFMLNRLERRDPTLSGALDWAMKRALFVESPRGRSGAWTPAQLFELDTKFGRLGDAGIFTSLDRQPGLLEHRLEHARSVDEAMRHPPAAGRARVRGEAIRRLSGVPGYRADWTSIVSDGCRAMDLSDPFVADERWSEAVTLNAECHME